jgi:transposase
LENSSTVTLANPKYVKALSGKKTDKKDSRWIADLFKHDLVPGSYIPPKEIRMIRELCRYENKLVSNRSSEKNRIQNSLTVSNLALANVVSDAFGKTASRIIEYVVACDVFDPEHCKTLIDKRIKASHDEVIKSILGYNLVPSQASKIKLSKAHLNFIDDSILNLNETLVELTKPYESQIKILTSMVGVNEKSAIKIISEIGADMSVFNSAKHLCSWAGLTPQNNESAGKKKSSKISRAGVYIKPLLVQCANAAIKSTKNPYFRDKFLKIKKRRGHKKAIIAIARMMLTCIFHMLSKGEMFAPSDVNYSDMPPAVFEKRKQKMVKSAIALLQKQGFQITKVTDNELLAG